MVGVVIHVQIGDGACGEAALMAGWESMMLAEV
jgi:hypothetical protein